MKYALYVPSPVGAVMVKVSVKVPDPWSALSKHVKDPGVPVAIAQPVAFQLLLVVTFMTTVIEAPGRTVTVLAPFNVTELIVAAAVCTVCLNVPEASPLKLASPLYVAEML